MEKLRFANNDTPNKEVHAVNFKTNEVRPRLPRRPPGSSQRQPVDDSSFNLLIGATDLGTGSDTILAQIAAEILGISLDDVIIYSSDTDFTPFDKGAYASSTTYISGGAVRKAAVGF